LLNEWWGDLRDGMVDTHGFCAAMSADDWADCAAPANCTATKFSRTSFAYFFNETCGEMPEFRDRLPPSLAGAIDDTILFEDVSAHNHPEAWANGKAMIPGHTGLPGEMVGCMLELVAPAVGNDVCVLDQDRRWCVSAGSGMMRA
jgi:hypothetical protein